jgi:hypothetical protein
MADLEREIKELKERNARVESDKAWETSWARRTILALGTYLLSVLLLMMIGAPNPFLAALVPSLGFLLSTMTLPLFKNWWLSRRTTEGQ